MLGKGERALLGEASRLAIGQKQVCLAGAENMADEGRSGASG